MIVNAKTLCLMWHMLVLEDDDIFLTDKQLETACKYSQEIIDASYANDIDPFIISSLIYNESRYTVDVTNQEGACGLGQIVHKYVPETCEELKNPTVNIKKIAEIINSYIKQKKTTKEALACYASGPKCTYKKYGSWITYLSKKLKKTYQKVIDNQNVESSN